MIKKVNVKDANTLWIWLTLIPFANGFILMSYANRIFNKIYKFIGLGCSLATILFCILPAFCTDSDILINIITIVILVAWFACPVAALIMRGEYKYRKGVLNYADKYHVLYNDFETAENEVAVIIEKEKTKQM